MYYRLASPRESDYPYYEQHLVVDQCGKVLRTFGTSVKDKERGCWARDERVSKLSDEELINTALPLAATRLPMDELSSVEKFLHAHPACCSVKRNVRDELYPQLLNAAQVDIYFPAKSGYAGPESHVLVAFNACGDFAHLYGPQVERPAVRSSPK
jgi:hypothetical protein